MAVKGRSYVDPIIRRGADGSAPVDNSGPLAITLVLTAPARRPDRALVAMSSAPAEVYTGTVAVISAQPARPSVTAPVVTQAAQDQGLPPVTTTTAQPVLVLTTTRTAPGDIVVAGVGATLVAASITTAIPVVVRPHRRGRGVHVPLLKRAAVQPPLGTPDVPDIDTPTSVDLDAHASVVALDEHASAVTLDAHLQVVVLDTHASTLTLDGHATSLELDP